MTINETISEARLEKSQVISGKCYGCGVCAVTCPNEAIKLHRVERSQIYKNPIELIQKIYQENRTEK